MTVDTPDYVAVTSLHHGKNVLFNSGTQVVAPGATYNSGFFPFNKPGYLVFLTAIIGASTVTPFCLADVTWHDIGTGNFLDEQQWAVPAGTPNLLRTNGRGPTIGDGVRFQITNLDAIQSVTIHLIVFETTHASARHDWRSQMNNNWTTSVAGVQAAPCAPFSGTLFQGSPSIPANATEFYQLALYAGQVQFSEADAGAVNLSVTIGPTQDLETASSTAALYSFVGSPASVHGSLLLPRQPCVVKIVNTNAAAVVCNLNIGVVEYAS